MADGKWKRVFGELGIGDAGLRAIGWLTAGIGIYSGYALFLMLWEQREQGETVLEFLLALAAAAALLFAFEFLRSIIEGGNHTWSFPRVLATIVMLAAFELFIIATESAVGLGGSVAVQVAGFIFGEQFADKVSAKWNLVALAALWLFVALTMIGKLRKFIEGWPYPDSAEQPAKTLGQYLADMALDLLRGAWAGVLAGAFWGAVASVAYVFFFRAIFFAQWIHANPGDWGTSMASMHLPPAFPSFIIFYPLLLAGWCAEKLGAIGLFLGVALAMVIARGFASEEGSRALATLWPPVVIVLVLGSPILTKPTAWHGLLSLAYLSAVIWGIPGLLLGLLAPLLRGAAHHPPVWGMVAAAAAAVMLTVTLARFQVAEATRTEKGLLIVATGGLVFLALRLFQGRWSEEFWLFVALSVGLVVFGTTRAAQRVNLFEMQKNAATLINLPVTTAPTPMSTAEEVALVPILNFSRLGPLFPETFFDLVPRGVNPVTFEGNPCEAVREFTPEQRALFVGNLQREAAEDLQDANNALTNSNTSMQHLQSFQQQWAMNISTAGSDPKPRTPEMQISEVRERLGKLEGLDDTRKQWVNWAATPPPRGRLLHLEEPATVCQTDLDNLLADMNRADQDRTTAEASLAALRQRIGGELPPEDDLNAAEGKAAQLRDNLQTQQAQRLELAMTSSLGFWLTIGLLAMWRLTRPEPD